MDSSVEEEGDEEEQSSVDEEEGQNNVEEDYQSIFDKFTEQWMTAELDHTISKVASNAMWELSFKFIPKLLEAKIREDVKKKVIYIYI